MSHWYDAEGNPHHTSYTKDGRETPTTLRHARNEGYLPSVTTVLGCIHNQQLVDWKVRVSIEHAINTMRRQDEETYDFVQRCAYEAMQVSRDATGFGSEIHHHLEQANLSDAYVVPPEAGDQIAQTVEHWRDYKARHILSVIQAEQSIGCPELGLAGTVDLVCEDIDVGLCVQDYKTQQVRPNRKGGPKEANFYPSFGWQLALYSRMYRIKNGLREDPWIISHVIDSTEAGPIWTKRYTREEQNESLKIGLTLAKLWFLTNRYFPPGLDMGLLNQ